MRASRLVAILMLLQRQGRVTAEDLARQLEVSVRTIYRDVESLGAAGIPVYGDRGPGGGFALLDGFRSDLTGLAPAEAEAMLLIGLPGPAAALGLGPAAATAEGKLLASLPPALRTGAGRIGRRFLLDPAPWYRRPEPVDHLPLLARAVLDDRALAMGYESWTARRTWRVGPLGLVLKAGDWYLVADDGRRVRMFRVAAIEEPAVLDDPYERPKGFDLAAWWPEAVARFERDLRPVTATVRASARGRTLLARQSAVAADAVRAAGPPDRRGWCTLRLPVERTGPAADGLLALGPEIEVLAPAALRRRLHRLATGVAARHAPRPAGTLAP